MYSVLFQTYSEHSQSSQLVCESKALIFYVYALTLLVRETLVLYAENMLFQDTIPLFSSSL